MSCSRSVCFDRHRAGIFLAVLAIWAVARAGEPSPVPPAQLVREAIANELNAAQTAFIFRVRSQTPQGSETKLCVQTREGSIGILIAINDQPLDPDRRQAEESRLDNLAQNPAPLRRKKKQDKEDADHMTRIMRALPDAFNYEYAGIEQGSVSVGKSGDSLVRLRFWPNPKYYPPTQVEQVLTGMQGVILIDKNRHRLAAINGTLYKDVSFGWGLFGHLDKGGQFEVEQAQVVDDSWEVTRMNLNFTGKILLLKNLVIRSSEVYTGFQPVPRGLNLADAIALLKRQDPLSVNASRDPKL